MKLILPIEVADEIKPHLPSDITFARADVDGNIDGDATDAEVYFSWLYYIKPTTLQKFWMQHLDCVGIKQQMQVSIIFSHPNI